MSMRFYEFAPIKPIKPRTPPQARIAAGKHRVDTAKDALKRERDAQRQQRERDAKAKQQRRR